MTRINIPTQKKDYVDVVAGVVVKDDLVFAAERGYGVFKGFWEYPGGKVEENEDFESALIRELREELNIRVGLNELTYYKTFFHEYPNIKVALHLYIVRTDISELELLEHTAFGWFSREDIDSVPWLESTYKINKDLQAEGIIK